MGGVGKHNKYLSASLGTVLSARTFSYDNIAQQLNQNVYKDLTTVFKPKGSGKPNALQFLNRASFAVQDNLSD